MKVLLSILLIGISLIALPLNIFASFLLYQHVHATELMWFLWWATTPISIVMSILSQILIKVVKD